MNVKFNLKAVWNHHKRFGYDPYNSYQTLKNGESRNESSLHCARKDSERRR